MASVVSVVVTQRIEWDMGHRLGDGYQSKCRHAHGHRYVADLTFAAPTLDAFGMVLDFGDIKRIAKGWIDEHIDHAFLVYEKDRRLLEFLRIENNRHCVVDFNTTVENIAGWLGPHLQAAFDADAAIKARAVRLSRLRVYETPNAWADWSAGTTGLDP